MPYTNQQLRALLAQSTRRLFYEGEAWTPALVGKPIGVASWTFTPPGFSGWLFVRLIQADGGQSLTRALNTAGVAETGDLEVWVGKNLENQWEIKRLRRQGF
jgi:hypothetical protein